MTRFRIGAGLLIVLLALSVFSQLGMGAIQKPIAAQVDRAQTLAAREDWPAAGAAVAEARQEWENSRTFIAALADHQPLEDIECLFAMLASYARERDGTEFQAACAELSRRKAAGSVSLLMS